MTYVLQISYSIFGSTQSSYRLSLSVAVRKRVCVHVVISAEVMQEVEARMNRQHIPPLLPAVAPATHHRSRLRKSQISALPTVQESHRSSGIMSVSCGFPNRFLLTVVGY